MRHPFPNPKLCAAGSVHWMRDCLCEAGLINAVLPSVLVALFVAAALHWSSP